MNANRTSRSRALPGTVAVPASPGGKHRGRPADQRPGTPGRHRRRQDDTPQDTALIMAGAEEASC